jgi:Mrp family chromosome partitioning ATPase
VGPRGLSQVKAVIAVSSGKGGVGKSSVAVNLAYALSQRFEGDRPLQVGILDADIHGPSLPTMAAPASLALREHVTADGDSLIEPLVYEGVKLVSYGYVPQTRVVDGKSEGGASALMRGPMAAQMVNELATRYVIMTYG